MAPRPLNEAIPGRSICLYTPSVDPSGMGEHMLDLASEFVAHANVSLMAWPTVGGSHLLERAEAMGVRTLALPRPRDPAFGEVITLFLSANPVDVFHIHVGTGRENFDGARAARRAGVPVVIQTQHLPWLMRDPRKRNRLVQALEPVDHVIAVSEAQRKTYERVGLPQDRFTTIPNGIRPRRDALGRLAARQALGLEPDQLVVLVIGRLTDAKGQTYLVQAVPSLVRRFPNLAVVLLGRGPSREHLLRQAAALAVSGTVRLAGYRPDARLLLDAADVFVLPSQQEGMPLAVLEAMDAGIPVVATNVIGTSEVVVDGETGILVPPRNPKALAAAIEELLSDTGRRRLVGAAGRRWYLERFTASRMADETARVYARLLGSVPSMDFGS
ncbi:MAG TPA: glycosyltransferase family 4 protein [Actinomycetota bacterium]|nr:glycosyltransferase family 4 protein [Actinomycetota bacterium]